MAAILGSLSYYSIALSTESKSLSAKGLVSINSGMLRFLTALEKKRWKISAFFSSCVVPVSSSTKEIFSFDSFSHSHFLIRFYRQYLLHSSLHNNLF